MTFVHHLKDESIVPDGHETSRIVCDGSLRFTQRPSTFNTLLVSSDMVHVEGCGFGNTAALNASKSKLYGTELRHQ